ncbi:unnamed protein product [Closterium sp. NIES-64]|nr:unnamed protein product [Closterium sp. NIES-64]
MLLAPSSTADSTTRSQWQTRDAHARFAIRNSLPIDEREHFGQHKTAQALYTAVVARYSSPASPALGRLSLPYLFPDLSSFSTIADLITHLRTIRDHFLARCPTELTIALLEKELLAAEASIVAPLLLLPTSLVLRRSGPRRLRAGAAVAKANGAREAEVTAGEAVVGAVAAVGVVAGLEGGNGGGGGGSGGGGGRGEGGGGGSGGRGGGRGGGGRGGSGGGGGRGGAGSG